MTTVVKNTSLETHCASEGISLQYTHSNIEEYMIILGIVGEQGAGKGTAAQYIQKKYQAYNFRFSAALDDILARLSIPNERKNVIALVTALRGIFGEDILAKTLAHDIQTGAHAMSVVDGIRMPSELEILETLPGFQLIYITAPIESRYEKIKARKERANEESLSLEEFQDIEEKAVTEIHIPILAKRAKYRIENTGTLEELYAKIDEIIASLPH